ncbi:uncharacterized protein LOC129718085 [Wyeomyia smithii]|uniref:uncharacterized protein LOC129718085 n=1 Tax=Wyeomyia smithii TaxID=174621 RepID=UPI002467C0F6|nr:uncharacterized protein LOC129718085 [Wyeomyia smithii]
MELIGHVKNYEWGKLGDESYVARIAAANQTDGTFVVDANKPYAELWMGTHCSGPSLVKQSGLELGSVIRPQEQPTYLFKVLSIQKALSIQLHPNKMEATALHAKFPDIYKDPNHKPELAIALTEFKAMCGFRRYTDIYSQLQNWPELQALLGADEIAKTNVPEDEENYEVREVMRNLYSSLMNLEPEQLEKCISSMHNKILAKPEKSSLDQLFLELHNDFGSDVGLLSIYFLNVLDLQPGQSIYLAANVPHAYIRGDCVECMSCSDNVVRAGLTPKFKDIETLLRLVEVKSASPESLMCEPIVKDPKRQPYTRTYCPNDPWLLEFSVSMLTVPPGVNDYPITNGINGSILLVTAGKGTLRGNVKNITVQFGSIVFLSSEAGAELQLWRNSEDLNEEFVAYLAMQREKV